MHFSKTSNAVEPPFQGLCCIIDPPVKGEFQLTQKTSYKWIMKELKDLMYSRGFADSPLTKDNINALMSEIYRIGIRQKMGAHIRNLVLRLNRTVLLSNVDIIKETCPLLLKHHKQGGGFLLFFIE